MAVFEYIGGGGGGGGVQTVVAGDGISVDATDAENPIVSSSVVGYPAGTKMYLALLTQSGTSAPVATVLVNTLGGTVVWARTDIGTYTATLSNAWTNKTLIPPYLLQGTAPDIITVSINSTSEIEFSCAGGDGSLTNFPIQILVFP